MVVAELSPTAGREHALTADAGRSLANADVVAGPISFALLDLPHQDGTASILLAASSSTSGWKRQSVEITLSGQRIATETARSKSVLGLALGVLGGSGAGLVDDINTVDVELTDHDQWLVSCDDDALIGGGNLAMLGAELIQFGRATSLGAGRFRLDRLLRARGGTEWASAIHAAGDMFCLVDPSSLASITSPSLVAGATVELVGPGSSGLSSVYTGEGLRPLSPVDLTALRQSDGTIDLTWTRRSRLGYAWVDEIDAPLGEAREQYRVALAGVSDSFEFLVDQTTLSISGVELAPLGTGAATIQVRQIGDFAASRPAQITITLT